MSNINLDLNISLQALAVQAGLKTRNWEHLPPMQISTYHLLNGRECGLCLEVRHRPNSGQALLVSFGEHRNTDEIFVQTVATSRFMMNGPELKDFTDASYQKRKFFDSLDIASAVQHIFNEIDNFILGKQREWQRKSA